MMSGPPAAASVAEELGPPNQNLGRWSKSISEKDTVLAIQVAAWLRKRGKALRPKLNDEQKQQLEECFELMDADGSGAIDADELGAAFKLLGLQVKRAEIGELLAEVDSDGSGEVEYPEFIEVMTSTLAKLAEKKEQEGSACNQVPFALLATAYRRKRIMEGLISGDKEMTAQVVAIAEDATRRAAEEAAAHQAQHGHHASHGSSSTSSHSSSRSSSTTGSVQQGATHGTSEGDSSSNSSSCSGSSRSSASLRAVQAAAPQGLLRSLQKLRSMKNSAALLEALTAADSSSSSAIAGGADGVSAGCAPDLMAAFCGDLAAVLEEQEHAQLVQMLRQGAQERLSSAQQANAPAAAQCAGQAAAAGGMQGSGSSSPAGGRKSSSSAAASPTNSGRSSPASGRTSVAAAAAAARPGGQPEAPAAALLVAKQRMTSQLQQRVLTQEVQMPKIALSMSRNGAGGLMTAAAAARSSSSGKTPSTSSSPVPLHLNSPSRHSVTSPSSSSQSLNR